MDELDILQGKRVFIIEDNLQNRSIMQLILEQFDVRVAFERWGTQYLRRMEAFSPVDVILLDLMFPGGITGYQIFDQIKLVPAFERTPVVAVSAKDPSVAVPATRDKGFSGFIQKPIDMDRFPRQIARILHNQSVWER